jgi:hypothetical protein
MSGALLGRHNSGGRSPLTTLSKADSEQAPPGAVAGLFHKHDFGIAQPLQKI